jgi:hypothetical protein
MERDTIQLVIELLGQEGLERLAQAAEQARARTQAAADSYGVLDTVIAKSVGAVGTYEIATDRVNHELDDLVRTSVEATQAQRAMAEVLADIPSTTAIAAAGVDQLKGKGGASGYGLMGASYALQDFVTVISMGGGFGRAMMSMANNITPVLAAMGMGAGLAGVMGTVFTLASAGAGVLEKYFTSMDSEVPEKLSAKLEDAADRAKRLQSELDKILKSRPMAEKETAGLVESFFAESDPEQLLRGFGAAVGASPGGAKMTKEEAAGQQRAREGLARATLPGDRAYWNAVLSDSQAKVGGRLQEENRRAAGELIARAPTDATARRRLRELAAASPGGLPANFAAHLGELEPEAVAAQDADYDAFVGAGEDAIEAGKKRRKAESKGKKLEEFLDRDDAALRKQARGESKKRADQAEQLEEFLRRDDRALAAAARREKAQAGRDAKAGHKADRSAQADELLSHGPEIVGRAMGPQAAAMASRADPEQVAAMKARTIKALDAGQTPYQALLEAFSEVARHAERQAQQQQRFNAQLHGLRSQSRSRTQRFGDTSSHGF